MKKNIRRNEDHLVPDSLCDLVLKEAYRLQSAQALKLWKPKKNEYAVVEISSKYHDTSEQKKETKKW